MTVQNMTVKNVYEGNGSATVFPYTFVLSREDGEHVGVYVTDENNISRRVTNFTVDTAAKTVKYPIGGSPLPAGKRLTLRREIPAQQELNLENQGAFFAEDVETQFDRLVLMIQQLAETLQRAIVVDVASDKKPEDLLLEIMNNLRDAVAAMNRAVEAANHAEAEAERSHQEATEAEESAIDSANSAGAADQKASLAAHSADEARAAANLSKAWAESEGSPDGRPESRSAKTWAKKAEESAQRSKEQAQRAAGEVSRVLSTVQEATLYDPSSLYLPGECVMVENGDVYRCTRESQGENPVTSPKWVSVATTIFQTFELDENGDFMPLAFPQSSTLWSVDDNGDIMVANI